MNVPNRSTAKYIDKNWGDKAAKVYLAIYDNLVDQP
ncbi:MAG: hypothetical protein PHW00_04450 [Clostridia bacterium]|nr:hypothetical protein [Clostridia bacterium]